jgi:hypothetical protein
VLKLSLTATYTDKRLEDNYEVENVVLIKHLVQPHGLVLCHLRFRVSWSEKKSAKPLNTLQPAMLKWVIKGGNKNAIDHSVIRNDSISGKGRTGLEVQEILCGSK